MTTAQLLFRHLRIKTWLNYIDMVVSLFSLAEAAKRLKLQLAALIATGFPMQLPATAVSNSFGFSVSQFQDILGFCAGFSRLSGGPEQEGGVLRVSNL